MKTLHDGNSARIIKYDREPDFVYKLAIENAEAFLQNEQAAYTFIAALTSTEHNPSESILTVYPLEQDPQSKKSAIKISKINTSQTLEGVLYTELGIPYEPINDSSDSKETRFVTMSCSIQKQTYTAERVMMRFGIFTALLKRTDAFDGQLSQNDFDPSNIQVQTLNNIAYDIRLFDFNCAITTYDKKETPSQIGHFTDLSGIPAFKLKDRSYSFANKIRSNKKWAHPNMLKDGKLEDILKPGADVDSPTVTPTDMLHHNDLYQAAGLLYWSLTGKTLNSSDDSYVSLTTVLPKEQKILAEKADALIAEAKKELGRYDKTRVAQLREEIKTIISSYVYTQQEECKKGSEYVVVSSPGLDQKLRGLHKNLHTLIPAALASQSPPPQHEDFGSAALARTLETYQKGLEEKMTDTLEKLEKKEVEVTTLERKNAVYGISLVIGGALGTGLSIPFLMYEIMRYIAH